VHFPRHQGSLSLRQQQRILSHQQTNLLPIDYISISKQPIRAAGQAGPVETA